MQLTRILCRYKKRLPRGHLWRGKNRLYKEVTPKHLNDMRLKFDLEEKNMFYLRHPYLTIEQSYGHAYALGKRKEFIDKHNNNKTWKEHCYAGDRFGYLLVADRWEK